MGGAIKKCSILLKKKKKKKPTTHHTPKNQPPGGKDKKHSSWTRWSKWKWHQTKIKQIHKVETKISQLKWSLVLYLIAGPLSNSNL